MGDTGRTDMDTTDMATDTDTTMERDLLMLSPLPMLLPVLRPRLIPGTDTTERGLLMLSPLPMLLPVLRLRPIPGTDTTDTGHTAMDTTATDLMDMDTTMERGLLMLSPLL